MPIQCAGVYKHVWAFEKKSKLSFIVILYSCKPTYIVICTSVREKCA